MQHALDTFLALAGSHPVSALAFIAFAESLAIIGTFVPAAIVMFGAGALVGHGTLDFSWALGLAAAGAVAGDALSYELGRHQQDRVRAWPMFRRYAQHVQTAEGFIARHGAVSILMARFTGAVRAFVPLLAGFAQMPGKFYVTNVASALLWAPAHILPGVVFGASEVAPPGQLDPHHAGQAGHGLHREGGTGPGIKTALLQVAAEELVVRPERITLVTAETERTPNEGHTAGSRSMQDSGTAIRNAAAQLRALLVGLAATKLGQPAEQLKVADGVVSFPGGAQATYGEVVTGQELHVNAAAQSPLRGTAVPGRAAVPGAGQGAHRPASAHRTGR